MYVTNWAEWKTAFAKGKTPVTYILILVFPLILVSVFLYAKDLPRLVYSTLLLMIVTGLFVDTVAHLLTFDSYIPVKKVSPQIFWQKVWHGRTHDFYGVILAIILLALMDNAVSLLIIPMLCIGFFIITAKFYH